MIRNRPELSGSCRRFQTANYAFPDYSHVSRIGELLMRAQAAGRLSLSLNGLATDLDTEHAGTDANRRDGARQVGRLNVAGLQL
jgi:hypothetical protein